MVCAGLVDRAFLRQDETHRIGFRVVRHTARTRRVVCCALSLAAEAYAASSMKEILFGGAAMKRMELASWCPILEDGRSGNVALIYSSDDLEHKNAVALKGFLIQGLHKKRIASFIQGSACQDFARTRSGKICFVPTLAPQPASVPKVALAPR